MWLVRIVGFIVAIYIFIVAVLFLFQTRLLFPTELAAGVVPPISTVLLEVETQDGELLRGLHIPPARSPIGQRLIVLGFGGNAWSAERVAVYLHGLFSDAEAVAFHYRGYRPSTGTPSAAALLSDAPAVFDYVEKSIGQGRIIAVGFSIGAAVAAHLATKRQLEGLILVSPFDSLEALVREHYPWVPVSLLLRHQMSTEAYVRGLSVPIALIAAGEDTVVSPQRTVPVRRAISSLVFDRTIANVDHNAVYERSDFRAAMVEALAHLVASTGESNSVLPSR